MSANVIGGRTTALSKQSLRTCNVDNELRQALVLLRCPPILDWRTSINVELAHYPRGRICGTVSIRGPVALLLVRTATPGVYQRTYSDGVTGPPWPCYSGMWPCDSELAGIDRTRFCDCLTPCTERDARDRWLTTISGRARFPKKSSKAIKNLALVLERFAKTIN